MNMNRIMVIPGSESQIPLVKRASELGYEVVCVNPYVDSPAFPYADFTARHDILDVPALIEVGREYDVCAIISDECDIAMPALAAASEALGTPSIGSPLAKLYTNKHSMRDFSKAHGFPAPTYRQCRVLEEALQFFQGLAVPKMIVKPLDSNSSRGVYTITSARELEDKFDKSLSFSHSHKAVLCEEFVEGTEFTVDGIVINGQHHSLAVSKKDHYPHHPNIACELYFSNRDPDFDYDVLRRQNDEYVDATGLPLGFTHAEYKFNGRDFVLIEIGARGGGNFISSHVVPVMTGLDNYGILIGQTLDLDRQYEYSPNPGLADRCCVLKFFDVGVENDGHVVKAIAGESLLEENPHVVKYDFRFGVGDRIFLADDDSKRVGYYIAFGDTREELDALMREIEANVRFELE